MTQRFMPNAGQRAAIEWRGGHALVLAGAGTGKTFTIIERTKSLIADGVRPDRIALLTFTRRAAQEMRSRIGTQLSGLFAGTFHAWGIALMYARPDLELHPASWTILDRDDQLQIMRMIKTQLVPRGESRAFPSPGQMVSYLGYARSTLLDIEAYLERFTALGPAQAEFIQKATVRYRNYCRARNYLDFDGILETLAFAFAERPDVAKIVAEQYDEILIDEGQDLNPLQWKIIDALVPYTRLFMVGDDAQSIYGFRGADFESIHSFTERVPNGTVLKLEENYRSGQRILDLANHLLAESDLGYDKHLVSTRGPGELPELHAFGTLADEAGWIGDTILAKHNDGERYDENKILVRTMQIGRVIEGSLIEREIPYVVIGGSSLFALAHTKDLIALVRVTLNIRDDLAWMRYLKLFEGIGDVTATRVIEQLAECNTIAEAREVIEAALAHRALDVLAPIRELARHANNPGAAIRRALTPLEKVFEHLYRADWKRRKPDLDLMVQLAERRNDLHDFIETYTLDPIHGTQATRPTGDHVTLITVHSAKGLEGKRIFIPQARYGVYPHVNSFGNKEDEEEERRVLYVAVTRAKDELLLSTAHVYGYLGTQTAGTAAPLVESIPFDLVERIGQSAASAPGRDPFEVDLDEWG